MRIVRLQSLKTSKTPPSYKYTAARRSEQTDCKKCSPPDEVRGARSDDSAIDRLPSPGLHTHIISPFDTDRWCVCLLRTTAQLYILAQACSWSLLRIIIIELTMTLVDTTLLLQLEAVFGSMLTSALQLLDRREGAIFWEAI